MAAAHSADSGATTFTGGVFNIRSWNDVVAMLYVIVPVAQIILVGYGVLDDEHAALTAGAVLAVLQTLLQFVRTIDWARKIFYTVLLSVNSVLVLYGVWNEDFLEIWLPLINTVLVGVPAAVAVQNVNTTGDNIIHKVV